jgi:hypothetical protein
VQEDSELRIIGQDYRRRRRLGLLNVVRTLAGCQKRKEEDQEFVVARAHKISIHEVPALINNNILKNFKQSL